MSTSECVDCLAPHFLRTYHLAPLAVLINFRQEYVEFLVADSLGPTSVAQPVTVRWGMMQTLLATIAGYTVTTDYSICSGPCHSYFAFETQFCYPSSVSTPPHAFPYAIDTPAVYVCWLEHDVASRVMGSQIMPSEPPVR